MKTIVPDFFKSILTLIKLSLLFFFLCTLLKAQVVTIDPPFATRLDSFNIIFDASLGDRGLEGYSGNDVYAHTGVIIEGTSSWDYVIAEWAQSIPKALLTNIGEDLWQLNIGNPYDYYEVPDSLVISRLAFVFKNGDQSHTGRSTEGNGDIFLDLPAPSGLAIIVRNPIISTMYGDPQRSPYFMDADSIIDIQVLASAFESQVNLMQLFRNDSLLTAVNNDSLQFLFAPFSTGMSEFKIVVQDTAGGRDSTTFVVMVLPEIAEINRPVGTIDGINYVNTSTARLSLFAPYKEHLFVIGDFNDWKVDEDFLMHHETIDDDNIYWWIDIENLTPGMEYAFQYLVDGEIRIADPYSELVLNRSDDQYVPESTYPNLKPYPDGMTDFAVSVIQTAQENYDWQIENFDAPPKEELIIYELLIRDFIEAHDYQTLIDTLDYLQNLGINAIELMPVNEFEGNESWGYNPAFHLALDKYYGTKNAFKAFIDECHARNIAVIIDIVLNHAFGQSPLVRLYASGPYGPPTSQNPWLNVNETHPYNVGYDFNHESVHTQYFVDRANEYWLGEYKIDGYRFDLTKGFMQTGSFDNYNAGRVALLKRMADAVWAFKQNAYVIFEHLGSNDEETELANYGIMLWGKMTDQYNEATMGYHENNKSDFSRGYYQQRGWNDPHLVTYMESHDEQRLMYKNLQFGNSSGNYNIKELETAIQRNKMAAAFLLTLPGPKMIWQFGELGYDYDIDYNGRTGNKPIRWDYFESMSRRNLNKTYTALLKLRRENEAFRQATSVDLSVSGILKKIRISYAGLNAIIVGNFGVTSGEIDPGFFYAGTWYDYFSGDTIIVSDTQEMISLAAGEFHIYTDVKLESPAEDPTITSIISIENQLPVKYELSQNFPNPFNPVTTIKYQIMHSADVDLAIYNMLGQKVATLVSQKQNAGSYSVKFNGANLASGIYFYTLRAGDFLQTRKMLLLK